MAGMVGENRPWSEIWREAASDWVDKDAAARMKEETKTLLFAQKCAAIGDSIPVNRQEQQIKASKDWMDEVKSIVAARTEANAAKVDMEYYKMKYGEQQSADANHRAESRL
jgi:hypothetical protein